MSVEFYWTAVAVTSVLSAARITRLFTWDDFPPTVWLREKYKDLTNEGPWALLLYCGYCFGFWAALGVVSWGYLVQFDTAWWLVNGVLSVAYLAAIVMSFDGDDG